MMTRRTLWILLCSLFLFVTACQKAPVLTLTGAPNIDLSADGSSGTITFTANRAWSISSSDAWVSISPSSGEASDSPITVTVRCNANTTYEDRTATVTIKMEELTQTVTVRQPANLGIVLPEASKSFSLESDARTIEVEVQSNVQYTVSTSVDWIKQTGTKALTSKTLAFSIEENTTYDAREGQINIKSQNSSVVEQVISVKQAQKDALIVRDRSFTMPYGGGEVEVKVEANVSFDVKPAVSWIHYVETKALNSSMVRLTIDDNPAYSLRTGTVEIIQRNGSLSHTITVYQSGRVAVTSITLDKTSMRLAEGETQTLLAILRPSNASDPVSWTSSNREVASVDESGKVTAQKEGKTIITAQAGDKSASCEVIVANYPAGNIVFADANIKEKLVAAFDANEDGEISYREAASVTSLEGVFGTTKIYYSFDEFQYFTGITSIPNYMFQGWVMSSITLPESIKTIGSYAFDGCAKLTSIVIPEGVSSVAYHLFSGCTNLTSITIPASVSSIDMFAFSGCSQLPSIVLPEALTSIDWYAFADCSSLESILIPKSVTSIEQCAFSGCHSLIEVAIPEGITSIEKATFNECFSLVSVAIPETVTSIGECAFQQCESLKEITIPDSVTRIAEHAFSWCKGLESIVLPKGITRIENNTFDLCRNLSSIVIPEGVREIGRYAFSGCQSLASITLPESLSVLDDFAFEDCSSLSGILVPDSVTTIGYQAFKGCSSLASITISRNVTTLKDYAFQDCNSLKNVTIQPGLTMIGSGAFERCSSLTEITIPDSITSIGSWAFSECSSLEEVTVSSVTPPTLGKWALPKTVSSIYVPSESVDAYKSAEGWSEFADRVQAISE